MYCGKCAVAQWQPVLVDETEWMVEDGVLELKLIKDVRRDENARRGPSSEWWSGVIAGEPSLDRAKVVVDEYVRLESLPPDQQAQMLREHELNAAAARDKAEEAHEVRERANADAAAAAAAEAALPEQTRRRLEALRAHFPEIPIEYGKTSD
mmetsp:Transcript_42478/g.88769  ORF Transcript_42478/g.88769 Transcript_42478/m.88769 type:complete len:152 (-) Transcript_42478:162-617(-)